MRAFLWYTQGIQAFWGLENVIPGILMLQILIAAVNDRRIKWS